MAGVAPEMNMEAHGGDEAHKQGFETQGRCHQSPKRGYR